MNAAPPTGRTVKPTLLKLTVLYKNCVLIREAEEGSTTQKEEEEERRKQHQLQGRGRKQAVPKKEGEKSTTTAMNLQFDFTQTLFISIPTGTTVNGSTTARKWREATPHQKKGGKNSTAHQKKKRMTRQATPKKRKGVRRTPPRRNEKTATPRKENNTTPRKCTTNQSNTSKKGRGRRTAPPKMRRANPPLYFYLPYFTLVQMWFNVKRHHPKGSKANHHLISNVLKFGQIDLVS